MPVRFEADTQQAHSIPQLLKPSTDEFETTGKTFRAGGITITKKPKVSLEELQAEEAAKARGKAAVKTKKELPAAQIEVIAGFADLISSMEELQKDKQKNNYITGIEAVKVLGNPVIAQYTPGFGAEWSGWHSDQEKVFQKFRKATTGAQASDRELKMLRPLLPGIWDKGDAWDSKSRRAIEGSKRAFKTRIKIAEKAGYDVSAFKDYFKEDNVPKAIKGAADPLGVL